MRRLILASGSAARRNMLLSAGLQFDTIPADLNEKALIEDGLQAGKAISEITSDLARAKASVVCQDNMNHYVIGSDQTLEIDGKILNKAQSIDDAREKLCMLRGRAHILHSCASLAKNGQEIFAYHDQATLKMHDFSDAFLDAYMTQNEDALLHCVGGYKIEGQGAWLFEAVEGDYFTIMGMPLLPLLGFLRAECGFLP